MANRNQSFFHSQLSLIVREKEDKCVTKRGTALVLVYKIDLKMHSFKIWRVPLWHPWAIWNTATLKWTHRVTQGVKIQSDQKSLSILCQITRLYSRIVKLYLYSQSLIKYLGVFFLSYVAWIIFAAWLGSFLVLLKASWYCFSMIMSLSRSGVSTRHGHTALTRIFFLTTSGSYVCNQRMD